MWARSSVETDFTNAAVEGVNFENAYVNSNKNGDCMLFTVSAAHTPGSPAFHTSTETAPVSCFLFHKNP